MISNYLHHPESAVAALAQELSKNYPTLAEQVRYLEQRDDSTAKMLGTFLIFDLVPDMRISDELALELAAIIPRRWHPPRLTAHLRMIDAIPAFRDMSPSLSWDERTAISIEFFDAMEALLPGTYAKIVDSKFAVLLGNSLEGHCLR